VVLTQVRGDERADVPRAADEQDSHGSLLANKSDLTPRPPSPHGKGEPRCAVQLPDHFSSSAALTAA
jgi:hypothetical protein